MSSGLPVFQIFDDLNKDQIEVGVNGFTYKNINELKSLILKYENMSAEEKKNLKVKKSV